jgi:hypothetical protein
VIVADLLEGTTPGLGLSEQRLLGQLLSMAAASSDAQRMMAEAKSLRQGDCDPPRADLYSWSTPEQTVEWQAHDLIATLAARVRVLEDALREITEAEVRLLAAKLEEWDMKDPPNEFTGHDYSEMASDMLAALHELRKRMGQA